MQSEKSVRLLRTIVSLEGWISFFISRKRLNSVAREIFAENHGENESEQVSEFEVYANARS